MADEEVITPIAGTPEHDEAMIKLADERLGNSGEEQKEEESDAGNSEVTEHTKPEGVADKYWNAETGVVDYAAMQVESDYWKNKAEGKESEGDKPDEDKPDENAEDGEAEKVLESKGLNMVDYQSEYDATGELSEKSYKELADAGIDENTVNSFIAGQQAIATAQRSDLLKDVGGEEGYETLSKWMTANVPADELATFNEQVASENTDTVRNAINNMNSKYVESVGNGGELLTGDSVSVSNGGFASRSEFVKAMNDPRYGTDPVYTKSVETKMGITPDDVFRQR